MRHEQKRPSLLLDGQNWTKKFCNKQQLFWSTFTHSLCQLDRFIIVHYILPCSVMVQLTEFTLKRYIGLPTGSNVIKVLYVRNLRMFKLSFAFPAQSNVCEKAAAYPSKAPVKCSILGQAPGLTHKHMTSLGRLARDKHSSLFGKLLT